MATERRAKKEFEIPHPFKVWMGLALVFTFVSFHAQAKYQNVDAKGKEGAKQSAQAKSSKKFALKKPLKTQSKLQPTSQVAKQMAKPSKVAHKTPFKKTGKAKLVAMAKPAPQTKFRIAKKAETSTHDMAKAFSMNQQNQLVVQNPKIKHADLKETSSKKMPNLLPTSNDSQRAVSQLEADSGVHGDDGYTRTQIVDAPVRRPAATAPKAPERVAITFEHQQDK